MLQCDFYNLKEPEALSEQIVTEADEGWLTWVLAVKCELVNEKHQLVINLWVFEIS